MPSGYSATLPDDIILDSGILYVNSDLPFGASRGGSLKFDPGIERKQVSFDGQRAAVKGLDRTVGFSPKITGTMMELSSTRLTSLLEPGSSSASAGTPAVTTVTPQPADELLASGDYLTEVRLAFKRGSGGFVWVRFPYALCTKYDVSGQDKDEGEIAIEIEARQDLATPTNTHVAPYVIEFCSAL